MHAVFCLFKHDRLRPFEHFVGDFHRVAAELFAHLFADRRFVVMVGRQAVHKHRARCGGSHPRGVDLVRGQRPDALGPDFLRLAHADPDVGVEHVGPGRGVGGIGQRHAAARGFGKFRTPGDKRRIGPVFLRRASRVVQPHLGAADHQRVAHIVPRVAQVSELEPGQFAEMLLQGQEIGQDLGGVVFVGQAVPDRHLGGVGKLLHNSLAEAAVLDTLKHRSKHPGRIGDRFLFADLAARRVKVGRAHAEVVRRNLKAAPGAGGCFFKNQRNVFAAQPVVRDAGFLLGFEFCGQ